MKTNKELIRKWRHAQQALQEQQEAIAKSIRRHYHQPSPNATWGAAMAFLASIHKEIAPALEHKRQVEHCLTCCKARGTVE